MFPKESCDTRSGICADAGYSGAVEFGEGEVGEGLVPVVAHVSEHGDGDGLAERERICVVVAPVKDRKSTRLNSSHQIISYAVFCLKKKKKTAVQTHCWIMRADLWWP